MICQHIAPIYVTLASVDPVWGWAMSVNGCCYVAAWTCTMLTTVTTCMLLRGHAIQSVVCITDAMHAIQMDTTLHMVHVCRRLLNEENENVSTNPRGGSCYMQCYCVLHSNTRTW